MDQTNTSSSEGSPTSAGVAVGKRQDTLKTDQSGTAGRKMLDADLLSKVKELPAILGGLGIILYGIISAGYLRFYSTLGVSSDEVGLSYAGTLSRSIGFLILLALPTAIGWYAWTSSKSYLRRTPQSLRARWLVAAAAALNFLPILICLGLFVWFLNLSNSQASRLQEGLPVASWNLGPFSILDVRAYPVTIEWTEASTPKAKALIAHKLFYLGQSEGTAVLYDPRTSQAIRAAIGSFSMVATSYCTTRYDSRGGGVGGECSWDDVIYGLDIQLPNADLADADLSGYDLTRANLVKATLRGANLEGTTFEKASLHRADLRHITAQRINFSEAHLDQANISGSILTDINFESATLKDVNLRGSSLEDVRFKGADLSGADLSGVKFTKVSFQGAKADLRTKWPKGFDPSRHGICYKRCGAAALKNGTAGP